MTTYEVIVFTGTPSTPSAHVLYAGRWGQYARSLYSIVRAMYENGTNVAHVLHFSTPVVGVSFAVHP
jgi:hypothetical protein